MFSYLPRRLFQLPFAHRAFSHFCLEHSSCPKLLSLSFQDHLKMNMNNIHLENSCLTRISQEGNAGYSRRLESIPYLELLNSGLQTVRHGLIDGENQAIADALQWTTEVFDYNVIHGKKIRAIALLKAYAAYGFKEDDDHAWREFDSEGWKAAIVLAWCVEILQAFFIVADDIMDESKLRRGLPCWYQLPNVGLCAINDSLLLQCSIFKLIESHFRHKENYQDILHKFIKITHKTVYGQCIDMLSNPPNQKPKLENFTFEKYKTLVEYKTSNYTYCLPVHVAMHLAGGYSKADFAVSEDLCLKSGLYFQSQDDFLDCFGDPKVTGKFSNDINEGKCTWFAVKFLETASPELKEEFKKHFAVNDKKSISRVLELYEEVSLREKFEQFDAQLTFDIQASIKSLNNLEAGLFYNLFSQISKRDK